MATKPHDSGAIYRTIWGKEDKRQDYKVVTEEERRARQCEADKLNEAYYDMITDLYQRGWGNKFHFCGYQPGESWQTAQARHDHHLAWSMGVQSDWKLLDMGCGVGGPAREIAGFTGCHVTGVTVNSLHVDRGTAINKQVGLHDQVTLVQGNYMALPFERDTFHAAYGIEAICCGPHLLQTYREAFRVLKPGGVLGNLEWVITPRYDDGNEEHRRVRYDIERGGSVPHLKTAAQHLAALEEAGFEIVWDEDRAIAKNNPIPWWHSLAGLHAPTLGDKFMAFKLHPALHRIVSAAIKVLHRLGLTHPSQMEALDSVAMCTFGCRDGGRLGIFTPMHLMIARKPPAARASS